MFNGKSIPVYGYIPERDKKKTKYPCVAYLRHQITIREHDKRPNHNIVVPSETTQSDPVLLGNVVEGLSGPTSFTVKPYSTPIDIMYEIVALSTKKEDNNYLLEMMYQTFPPGYTAQIGDHFPLFYHGTPIISDQLGLPLYKTSFLLEVTDIWIDRLESKVVPAMTDIDVISVLTP